MTTNSINDRVWVVEYTAPNGRECACGCFTFQQALDFVKNCPENKLRITLYIPPRLTESTSAAIV